MAENLTRQILREHLAEGELDVGSPIGVRVDQTLLQDATGTMAFMQFEQLGVPRVRVERAVQYIDHNVVQLDFKNPDDHRMLQAMARKYGAYFSRPGNGISHYISLERFAKPGQILVGADSHTTTSGALGMIAIGAGGLDVAVAMAGYPFEIACPAVVEVRLEGTLARPWVQAKDIILELLRRLSTSGGKNKVFEFTGPGTADLSIPERGTIANMIAELGATSAVFAPDAKTRDWLAIQQREDDFAELGAEDGCDYDERVEIDLGALGPLVAKPSNPDNVVPVEEVAGTELAQVCIGSSVNSGYFDLALPAAILADRGGQIVHPDIAATATPGSRQIFGAIAESGVYRQLVEGGVRMLEPVGGPYVGMGQAPPSDANSLRTFNRNFPGRSGTPEDSVFLCSPAVAAVSMVAAIAEFTFRHRDPEFRSRLKEWGSGFIVGGQNYGQGSSREHAALAPLQLGVQAVFAKSFARIHRRNLIAQGILPLTFADDADYERAEVGQTWTLPRVREELGEGAEEITVHIEESGDEFTLTADLAPKEREIVVEGGLLHWLQEHGEQVTHGGRK